MSSRWSRAEAAAVGDGGLPLISLGFMRRFDPGYIQMKQALADGMHGAPLVVHCISRGVSSAPGRHQHVERHRVGDPRVRRAAMASGLADHRGELACAALVGAGATVSRIRR